MKKPSKYKVFIVFVVLVVAGNHTCTGGPINSKSVEMTINDFHKKLFKIPSDAFCNQASIQEHPRLKADRLTSCGRPLPGGKISAVIIFFLSEIWQLSNIDSTNGKGNKSRFANGKGIEDWDGRCNSLL